MINVMQGPIGEARYWTNPTKKTLISFGGSKIVLIAAAKCEETKFWITENLLWSLLADRVGNLHNFKMTIVTDNIQVKNGVDFSFVCSKIPFAISCSSTLHHGEYNYIDLDLVTKYLLCTYKNEKMILAKIFWLWIFRLKNTLVRYGMTPKHIFFDFQDAPTPKNCQKWSKTVKNGINRCCRVFDVAAYGFLG